MTTLDPTLEGTTGSRILDRDENPETVHIVTWRLLDYDGRSLTLGGLQRWLLALIDLLRQNGHAVCVHQRANSSFRVEHAPGVTILGHTAATRAHGTPLFNLRAHREIPTDAPVIYMAEDVSYPRCRRRSIVIQHGIWWDGEFGHWKLRIAEHIVRNAVRRSAATICVDTNFINWFRARWPAKRLDERLHYVPNFIDTVSFGPQPEQPAAATEPVTICFPRRSEPRRGIMMMAEIAPGLLRDFPDVDFRFIVGSGHHTDAFRARMCGAPPRWTTEVLPFHRMREAYEHSAIVTIPTICGEGTSLSAIEAMYFGCAIVSTWVGGLPNLIQDRQNGLLIAPRAPDLRDALATLIEDRQLRCSLGASAMAGVLPQYGVDRWRQAVAPVIADSLRLRCEVAV